MIEPRLRMQIGLALTSATISGLAYYTHSAEFALIFALTSAFGSAATYFSVFNRPNWAEGDDRLPNLSKGATGHEEVSSDSQENPRLAKALGLNPATHSQSTASGLMAREQTDAPLDAPSVANLDYSAKIDLVDCDLRVLIENIIQDLAPKAHDKRIDLETSFAPEIPANVETEPGLLQQILSFIVETAIGNTNSGHVHLRVNWVAQTAEKQLYQFQIIDTGKGLSETAQTQFFDKPSPSNAHLDMGSCLRIVEELDGMMGVHSAETHGTTVWINLPMKVVAPSKAIQPKHFQAKHALLIDAVSGSRENIHAHLVNWNVLVHGASSATEALGFARNLHRKGQWYDLVILDKGLGSHALAPLIGSLKQMGSAPIIMLGRVGQTLEIEPGAIHKELQRPLFQQSLVSSLSLLPTVCVAKTSQKSAPPLACGPPTELKPLNQFASDEPQALSKEQMTAKLQNRHILIVDDNTINRKVAQNAVMRFGCSVELAVNGQDALDKVRQSEYDMVLMDCQMPVMDGYEATRQIRELPKAQNLPIIAVTANVMPGDRERCMQAGMNDYVPKPIRAQTLLTTMHRHAKDEAKQAGNAPLTLLSSTEATQAPPQLPPASQVEEAPPIDLVGLEDITGGSKDLMNELLNIYSSDTEERLRSIKSCLDCADYSLLMREAHSLKGASANLSAQKMHTLAHNLEQTCKRGEHKNLRELYEGLVAEFLRVSSFTSAYRANEKNPDAQTSVI